MDIQAVIFDLFGVFYLDFHKSLIERFPYHRTALNDLRTQADYGFLDRNDYLQAVSLLTKTDKAQIEQVILIEHSLNKPLLQFIVSELKPRYKIGLLSNIGRGWIQNFFDTHQLHDIFDAVVLSGDEGVAKPHPQIYELAAERLGFEVEQCLVVDDLPENIAGADAAGMKGLVYGNLRDMRQELAELLK